MKGRIDETELWKLRWDSTAGRRRRESLSNPLEVALPFPVGHCVIEGLDFQTRGVDMEIDDRIAKSGASERALVQQVGCFM